MAGRPPSFRSTLLLAVLGMQVRGSLRGEGQSVPVGQSVCSLKGISLRGAEPEPARAACDGPRGGQAGAVAGLGRPAGPAALHRLPRPPRAAVGLHRGPQATAVLSLSVQSLSAWGQKRCQACRLSGRSYTRGCTLTGILGMACIAQLTIHVRRPRLLLDWLFRDSLHGECCEMSSDREQSETILFIRRCVRSR